MTEWSYTTLISHGGSDPEKPAATLLGECLAEAYGTETISQGMGGSIPLTVELQENHPHALIALFGVLDP